MLTEKKICCARTMVFGVYTLKDAKSYALCAVKAAIACMWIFSATAFSADIPPADLPAALSGTEQPPPAANPGSPSKHAPSVSARTTSITGSGATYTGADLQCDFCTGRTKTVGTHARPAASDSTGGTVTGDESLFGKHNLTPTGDNTGEICAFCHTPQGDENTVSSPRWNRNLTSISSYRAFSSLGSATQEASASISMSCLSCHDGGQAPNIAINTPTLQLDVGNVDVTIGTALRNHHPVGIQYAGGGQDQNAPDIPLSPTAAYDRLREMNQFAGPNKFNGFMFKKFFNVNDRPAFNDILTLSKEGEFNSTRGGFNKSTYSGTGSGTVWWVKSPNSKIGRQKTDLYLFTRTDTIDSTPDDSTLSRPYVECATCHDPHSTNPTFLRLPNGNARSQICLACHNK
jgi:predicted CXXCH cytochrome family protein